MSKIEIRSPVLLTAAALLLAPAFAFAEGDSSKSKTTTTTTTTTSPQGTSTLVTPAPSSDMSPKSDVSMMPQSDIDPTQVQKVFGMDVALIDLKALNTEQLKVLQQRLAERGFYRGAIDGKMGPGTRNAISALMAQQYALNQRLVSQGQITEQFASSLGVDTRGRVPVAGIDMNAHPKQHTEPGTNARPSTPPPSNQ